MNGDFDEFVDALVELDSRARRRLPAWQQHLTTFAEFAASMLNDGLALTLSNHAHETDRCVRALEAIGASEAAGAVSKLASNVTDEGLGDEHGWDLNGIYDHPDLSNELEQVALILSEQEHSLWEAAEAFARSQGWRPPRQWKT